MALDDVAPQPIANPERPLEIHLPSAHILTKAGAPERRFDDVDGKPALANMSNCQAGAVHRDAFAAANSTIGGPDLERQAVISDGPPAARSPLRSRCR